ncbi:MAG: NUDIX domain-containing protein [Muribaculaceae bacterium]|nr:NUDIX domain-containing protein [Muribaculaceae bacterium]
MAHPLDKFKFCPACGHEPFAENGPYSKKCESCGFTYYDNPKAATVAIIINSNNEILVCRRAKEPAKGTLDLPGGFTDIGETAEAGVIREVKEETGLDVTQVTFLFSKPNIYPFSGMIVNTMDLFFICKVETTEGLIANDDVAETRFIPISELSPEEFGLRSIREAVAELKKMNL